MARVSLESCCGAVASLSLHSAGTMAGCSNRTSTVTVLREHCFNLLPNLNIHECEILYV